MNVAGGVKPRSPGKRGWKSRQKSALRVSHPIHLGRRQPSAVPTILHLTDQQKIRIGTCAWSFEEWSGPLYPADVPSNRWLEFYARYFPAVEIDSTFYSAPAEATARRIVALEPGRSSAE